MSVPPPSCSCCMNGSGMSSAAQAAIAVDIAFDLVSLTGPYGPSS